MSPGESRPVIKPERLSVKYFIIVNFLMVYNVTKYPGRERSHRMKYKDCLSGDADPTQDLRLKQIAKR